MSENKPVMKNAFGSGHDIYLDEFYYISYSDQKEQMTDKEYKEKYKKYLEIMNLPETMLKHKEIAGLHPEENPKYIKITGRMIMVWAEQYGFIPHFDKYFEKTRRLIMVPIQAWDFFNKHSDMLRGK